jgi:hypothetical protein
MEDDYMLNYNKIFDPSKFESYFSITAYIRMLQPKKKAPIDREDALYNKIKNFKGIHVTNDAGRRSERLKGKK